MHLYYLKFCFETSIAVESYEAQKKACKKRKINSLQAGIVFIVFKIHF